MGWSDSPGLHRRIIGPVTRVEHNPAHNPTPTDEAPRGRNRKPGVCHDCGVATPPGAGTLLLVDGAFWRVRCQGCTDARKERGG